MAVKVTQTKSASGATQRQRETLKGLGLGRVGKSRVVQDNPPTRGMIAKVAHLVTVEPAGKEKAAS